MQRRLEAGERAKLSSLGSGGGGGAERQRENGGYRGGHVVVGDSLDRVRASHITINLSMGSNSVVPIEENVIIINLKLSSIN